MYGLKINKKTRIHGKEQLISLKGKQLIIKKWELIKWT